MRQVAFILSLSVIWLCVLARSMGAQGNNPDPATNLANAIIELNFRNPVIDGCRVSYASKQFVPGPESEIHGFIINVNIETLDMSTAKIQEARTTNGPIYELSIESTPEYYLIYRDFLFFRSQQRKNNPNTSWPFAGPGGPNRTYPRIEFELRAQFRALDKVNHTISFTEFGTATEVFLNWSQAGHSFEKLRDFAEALVDFSAHAGCSEQQ